VLLETRQLPALMLRLLEAGACGAIHSLEVDDADLETLFTLLLEEST
jgi:hypothetical protein